MNKDFLRIKGIEKSFNGKKVLDGVSLACTKGETMSVLGRSGCGKTTLLKIIAGLESLDAGEITLDGKLMNARSPSERNIVYLYQEPLLFPHLNVFENIAFGLRIRKIAEDEIRKKVSEMISMLMLQGHAKKMPGQLSGGQRQRVAFGRALIISPGLFLLDEPFGNLDVSTRASMQELYQTISAELKITSLFVTHDLKEAVLVGNRFALMDQGQLTMYKDQSSFIEDERTGFQSEQEFWLNIGRSKNENE